MTQGGMPTDSFMVPRYTLVADVANRHRLPSLGPIRQYAKEGGLLFYGTSQEDADGPLGVISPRTQSLPNPSLCSVVLAEANVNSDPRQSGA
jgi:hypothetical protein